MSTPVPTFWPSFWPSFAPNTLTQSILPGLSFLTVNETNSSAPDAEQRIVAKQSYGRQIGKLMEAVEVLVTQAETADPKLKSNEAFKALKVLQTEVETAKAEASAARLKRLAEDLQALKTHDPDGFKGLIAGL